MTIEIKKADIQELEQLMKWRMEVLHEVFSLSLEHSYEELEKENRKYYQTALSQETHIACFACVDDKTVGCGGICFYQEMPSPDNPSGQCAYLMNIYTRPEYRSMGIGRKTVDYLIKQAQQRNIIKIYLETSESGRSLYQEMGFRDMPGYMKWKEA